MHKPVFQGRRWFAKRTAILLCSWRLFRPILTDRQDRTRVTGCLFAYSLPRLIFHSFWGVLSVRIFIVFFRIFGKSVFLSVYEQMDILTFAVIHVMPA